MKLSFKKSKDPKLKPDNKKVQFSVDELPREVTGDVLEEYAVDEAHVVIADDGGKGRYIIQEPEISDTDRSTYSLIMESLYYSLGGVAEVSDPAKYIEEFMLRTAEEVGLLDELKASHDKIKYFVLRDFNGYSMIDILIRDPEVEEISCEGAGKPVAIIHRRYSQFDWLDTNVAFKDEDALKNFVQKLGHRAGKSVTTAIPYVDAIMKEGHRIAVTFGDEVTLPGSTFDIRKFPTEPLSIGHLVKYGSMSPLMAAYYWMIVEQKGFVLIIGPMSSGKTTGINAIASTISPNMKICTIEDTPELILPHTHWERLKSRQTYSMTENKFDVDLQDLTKLALRYRPDYIIVGEARGAEIAALVQAAAIGHGCISSLHGDSPESALVRMSSPPMNVQLGGQMLVWNFLLMNRIRTPEGKIVRRALSSTEVEPVDDKIRLRRIFEWDARTDTFSPTKAEEVVKRSYRLETIMKLTGWGQEEMIYELERREQFLRNLIAEGKLRYAEVATELTRFYMEGRSRNVQAKRLPQTAGPEIAQSPELEVKQRVRTKKSGKKVAQAADSENIPNPEDVVDLVAPEDELASEQTAEQPSEPGIVSDVGGAEA